MFVTIIDLLILLISVGATAGLYFADRTTDGLLSAICGLFVLLIYLAYRILWRVNVIRRALLRWEVVVDKLEKAGLS